MKGEIKRLSHVADVDGKSFFDKVKREIELMDDLYVEIQYQQSIQLDGRALWSAMIIGRERND
jgi:hypothetical protein